MDTNTQAEVVILSARLAYHVEEFGVASCRQAVTHHPPSATRYRGDQSGHNWATDRANREHHYGVILELAARYFELTGEHYPLGFWAEHRAGVFDQYSKKVG